MNGEILFIPLWPKENGKGSSAVFHLFAVFEDLVEGLDQIYFLSLSQTGVKTTKIPTELSSTKLITASE